MPLNPCSKIESWRRPIRVIDRVSTVFPTGTSAIIDGITITNSDRVLFTNLSDATKNNRVYATTGAGSSLLFVLEKDGQTKNGAPNKGDFIFVVNGTQWTNTVWHFNASNVWAQFFIPSGGGSPVKERFYIATDYNSNLGDFRNRSVGSAGNYNFTFSIPNDFISLVSIEAVGIVSSGAAQTNRNIDLSSDYASIGENFQQHSETNTTILYDLSGKSNQLVGLDVSSVFSQIVAGDFCGLNINHITIGGSIEYIGIRLRYM